MKDRSIGTYLFTLFSQVVQTSIKYTKKLMDCHQLFSLFPLFLIDFETDSNFDSTYFSFPFIFKIEQKYSNILERCKNGTTLAILQQNYSFSTKKFPKVLPLWRSVEIHYRGVPLMCPYGKISWVLKSDRGFSALLFGPINIKQQLSAPEVYDFSHVLQPIAKICCRCLLPHEILPLFLVTGFLWLPIDRFGALAVALDITRRISAT